MSEEQKYEQYLKQDKAKRLKVVIKKVIGFLILTNILPVLGIIVKMIASDGYKYTCIQAYVTGLVVEGSAYLLFFIFVFSMSLLED